MLYVPEGHVCGDKLLAMKLVKYWRITDPSKIHVKKLRSKIFTATRIKKTFIASFKCQPTSTSHVFTFSTLSHELPGYQAAHISPYSGKPSSGKTWNTMQFTQTHTHALPKSRKIAAFLIADDWLTVWRALQLCRVVRLVTSVRIGPFMLQSINDDEDRKST